MPSTDSDVLLSCSHTVTRSAPVAGWGCLLEGCGCWVALTLLARGAHPGQTSGVGGDAGGRNGGGSSTAGRVGADASMVRSAQGRRPKMGVMPLLLVLTFLGMAMIATSVLFLLTVVVLTEVLRGWERSKRRHPQGTVGFKRRR